LGSDREHAENSVGELTGDGRRVVAERVQLVAVAAGRAGGRHVERVALRLAVDAGSAGAGARGRIGAGADPGDAGVLARARVAVVAARAVARDRIGAEAGLGIAHARVATRAGRCADVRLADEALALFADVDLAEAAGA